jgi:tetratricopeptide (TPR) repeat protein
MAVRVPSDVRRDVIAFAGTNRQVRSALLALAAAESLTDDTARSLIRKAGLEVDADRLIRGLHLCDFVLERNSEWQFVPDVRTWLVNQLLDRKDIAFASHRLLLSLATASADEQLEMEVPRYLRNPTGQAYHTAFLAPAEALPKYAAIAMEPLTGQLWLARKLAREQQDLGVLPSDALELDFLFGMVLYKEGKTREAEPLLRRVAASKSHAREVAIAAHLVGRMDGRRGDRRGAERLLRRSVALLVMLHDRFGEAQVLHTLGQLVGRDRRRAAEAEELLRRSLALEDELHDRFGEAQVLHTLGQLVGRDRKRAAEAEELLQRSLALLVELHDRFGEAQVLHTLGQLVGRDRRRAAEAEELLRRSLALEDELHNRFGEAQVLHTLGQLVGRDRRRAAEAEELLRRSLAIGVELRVASHEAQVLRTLAQIYAPTDREKAIDLLRRSLAVNAAAKNARGVEIVEKSLRDLGVDPSSDVAS